MNKILLSIFLLSVMIMPVSTAFDAGQISQEPACSVQAERFYLEEGDKVTFDGKEIELRKVGENAALISVYHQTLAIGYGEIQEYDDFNNFKIKLVSGWYIEGATDNSVTIEVYKNVCQDEEVPEFGVIAGAIVLALAGLFIFKKQN